MHTTPETRSPEICHLLVRGSFESQCTRKQVAEVPEKDFVLYIKCENVDIILNLTPSESDLEAFLAPSLMN